MRELDGLKDTIMEQIRGHTLTSPDKIQEIVSHEEDYQIFERILKELKAIRQVLENR